MSYHTVGAYQDLGFGIGDLNPAKYVGDILGAVARRTTGSRTANSAVSSAKSMVCGAVRTPGVAGGAAMASGGVGAVAVIGASAMCGPGQAPIMPPYTPAPSIMMPLILGGAALLVIAMITKKKKAPTP